MGRVLQAHEASAFAAVIRKDSPALTRSDVIDYACGLLGSLEQLAQQKQLGLLSHLTALAYEEACWLRKTPPE